MISIAGVDKTESLRLLEISGVLLCLLMSYLKVFLLFLRERGVGGFYHSRNAGPLSLFCND